MSRRWARPTTPSFLLLAQLRLKADFQVDQPVREQSAVSIPVRHGRAEYQVTLGPERRGIHLGGRGAGSSRVLAGRWVRREPQAHRELIEFLHDALSNEPDVRDLAWHQRTAYGQGDFRRRGSFAGRAEGQRRALNSISQGALMG